MVGYPTPSNGRQVAMNPNYLDFEQPIAELEGKIEELSNVGSDADLNLAEEIDRLREKSTALTEKIYADLSPWDIVRVARHPLRPYSMDYSAKSLPNSTSFMVTVILLMTKPSSAESHDWMTAR